jgi:multidrug efflux pump subunit AcrA (membrane-fusion protein)
MKLNQIVIIALSVLLVGVSFVVGRSLSNQRKETPRKEETIKARSVAVLTVRNQSVEAAIPLSGRLIASNKVEVYAEVGGVLQAAGVVFKEGNRFNIGQVLLKIDDTEARLNLLAQKSALQNVLTQMLPDLKIDYPEAYPKWNEYIQAFDANKPLAKFPETESDKERFFVVTKGIYDQYYNIKSAEERLRKHLITAPFAGVVVESNINPGTLIRTGQKLGEIMSSGAYELETSVNLKDIGRVQIGDYVNLYSEDTEGKWQGRVVRISDKMDASTQMVRLFVAVSGAGLREGMFLKGRVTGNMIGDVVELDRNLLVNGKQVFSINKQNRLKLIPVEVVRYNGANVVLKGIPNETIVLSEPVTGAFEGMEVRMRNN